MIARLLSLLLVVVCLAVAGRAAAQATDDLTREAVATKRKAVAAEEGLDDRRRKALLAEYDRALQFLDRADANAKRAAGFDASRAAVPKRLADAKAALAAERAPATAPTAAATLEALTAGLQDATRTAREAAARIEAIDRERSERSSRLPQIPTERTEANSRLQAIGTELAKAPDDADERLASARRLRLTAEHTALRAEVRMLDAEGAWYQACRDLLNTERDVATRDAGIADAQRRAWQTAVEDARQVQAAEAERRAQASSEEVSLPELKAIAEHNATLARRLPALADALQVGARARERTRDQLRALETRAAEVEAIIGDVGLTDAVGKILRKRRSWLKDRRHALRPFDETHDADLAGLQVERFELEQARALLVDLDAAVEQRAADLAGDLSPQRIAAFRAGARTLLEQRRTTIDEILTQSDAYIQLLRQIRSTENKLLERADAFDAYIEERILWIRSAAPIWDLDAIPTPTNVAAWFEGGADDHRVDRTIATDARRNAPLYLGLVLGIVALIALRGRIAARIERAGVAAREPTCVRFRPTIAALLYTLLLASTVPLILYLLGWRLLAAADTGFASALGHAFSAVATMLLGLTVTAQLCRPMGLGEAHFDLTPEALATVRTTMRRFSYLLPLYGIAQLFEQAIDVTTMDATGRGVFMLTTLASAVFLGSMFHPRRGILSHRLRGHTLLRRSAFLFAVGFPLATATLAALGYYLTALAVTERIPGTFGIVFGCLVAYWLAVRFFRVSRRALLLREEGVTDIARLENEDKRERFTRAEAHGRQLLFSVLVVTIVAGVWRIWSNVLPALGYWRELGLWSVESTVDGQPALVPVTLADLLMALVYAVVTVIAARSVPGMLRITVLRRLPEGDRLAFAKVAQYAIVFAGVMLALMAVRVQWSHLQWAVAGLSVGLGFGLQEIFANFISGLIILFERPIRVGDTVTVGQTQGKVAEIRVRSTTILDFDLRELIVPNKDFISKEIVNWTLSSPVTRAVIPVSVSIDADPERVRSILLDAATANARILEDPKPWAMFQAFGDSALQFKLMVYLGTRADWVPVVDGLHEDIVRAFRKAGIDFAFRRNEITLRRPHEEEPWAPAPGSTGEPEATPGA